MAMHAMMLAYGTWYLKRRKRYMGKLSVERFDHYNAIEPLIQAERDRALVDIHCISLVVHSFIASELGFCDICATIGKWRES